MYRTRSRATRSRRRARNLTALVLTAALVVGAAAVPVALARRGKTVVREARARSLHEIVLTNARGRTLYSLSAEKRGRFICTGSCTRTWFPLIVARRTKPKGPVKLRTTRRPGGKLQVTFKGHPLYTFYGDRAKGQANGEGFRDVGTWHAVTP